MSIHRCLAAKARRRLSPGEKYEMYVDLTGQATQREAADRWGGPLGGGTVIAAPPSRVRWPRCRRGRAGRASAPGRVEIEELRAECERLRATVAEQAVALHLHEGKSRWD